MKTPNKKPLRSILLLTFALMLGTLTKAQWTGTAPNAVLNAGFTNIYGAGVGTPISSAAITNITGVENLYGNTSYNNGVVQVNTNIGWLELGPKTSTSCGFYTSMPYYYFDHPIIEWGNISSYSTADMVLQTGNSGYGGTTRLTIKNVSGSSNFIMSGNLGAASDNNLTQSGDCGLFWTDGLNGGHNLSSGYVLAPYAASSLGIRIDGSNGNVLMGNSKNLPLVIGGAYASALNNGSAYLGFNASRNASSSNWTCNSDGSNNGAGIIYSDISGNMRFIPVVGTGNSAQTVTDAQVASDVAMTIASNKMVGIGTTTPAALLDVEESGNSFPAAIFNGADASGKTAVFGNGTYSLLTAENSPAGSYNSVTQLHDNGIFWTDGQGGGQNVYSGFVLAPWGTAPIGMRLDVNGNATFDLAPDAVTLGTCSENANIGYSTSYMGFNASRTFMGNWTMAGDGAHNGGSAVYGDITGNLRFSTIPSTTTTPQTLTDAQVLSDVAMIITPLHQVGIGTSAPAATLDVQPSSNMTLNAGTGLNSVTIGTPTGGYATTNPSFPAPFESYVGFNLSINSANNLVLGSNGTYGNGSGIFADGNGSMYFFSVPNSFSGNSARSTTSLARMAVGANGVVVLPTVNGGFAAGSCNELDPNAVLPSGGPYIFAVEGSMKTTEILVTPSPWCDYVFNKDYKLPSLDSVENYVNENKHLPDVPSAQEVKDNGIEVGKMDATLLKKIEELTLYTIELKKEMKSLNDEVTKLKQNSK